MVVTYERSTDVVYGDLSSSGCSICELASDSTVIVIGLPHYTTSSSIISFINNKLMKNFKTIVFK